MNSFELLDVFLFIGVSQGIFLAIALQTITNKNKSANRILAIILSIAAFMLFGRIVYFRYKSLISLLKLADFADTVIFLFGPLVYLYIRRLTFKETKKYRLPLNNYALAFILVVFYTWSAFYPGKEFYFFLKSININLKIIYNTIEVLAITSIFYYLYKSHLLIKLYKSNEKNNISYNQNVISFLNAFLILIVVINSFWLIGLCYKFLGVKLTLIGYSMIWITIPILIYLVGYYSLKQPDVFRVKLAEIKKPLTKRLEDDVANKLQIRLNHIMLNEHIYLDSKLTLKTLSEKLETSTNNLSWLLNSVYNCTFYEYINRSRIKAFISKIENGDHKEYTVLALSIDSGFNSKSTFNKAFKAEMNDTPSNYIKKISLN